MKLFANLRTSEYPNSQYWDGVENQFVSIFTQLFFPFESPSNVLMPVSVDLLNSAKDHFAQLVDLACFGFCLSLLNTGCNGNQLVDALLQFGALPGKLGQVHRFHLALDLDLLELVSKFIA